MFSIEYIEYCLETLSFRIPRMFSVTGLYVFFACSTRWSRFIAFVAMHVLYLGHSVRSCDVYMKCTSRRPRRRLGGDSMGANAPTIKNLRAAPPRIEILHYVFGPFISTYITLPWQQRLGNGHMLRPSYEHLSKARRHMFASTKVDK